MSSDYSIGDAALLVKLVWETCQNACEACGEHGELTREVGNIHRVLQRLNQELSNPNSSLNQQMTAGGENLTGLVNAAKVP